MNQIVPINANVDAYRASTDAATLCRDIVVSTAMEIQKRRYVRVEGWQALAVAHGCAASARDVEAVEGGVRAIGEVRRMSDGALIAQAEGFVGADEPTWYGGETTTKWGKKTLPKRPDYAIRAMAQTRAISRACRSAFAHVVVMMDAGLQTTPAEEVPHGGFDDDSTIDGQFEPTPQPMKSAHQARKDGDYERLTGAMRDCKDEEALRAWGKFAADDIGALPKGWQKTIRDEYVQLMTAFKAAAADPHGVALPVPADDASKAHWEEYFDAVLAVVGGATSHDEVVEAQQQNGPGIERAALLIDDAEERVAKVAETRLAELAATDEAA